MLINDFNAEATKTPVSNFNQVKINFKNPNKPTYID